MQAEIKTIINLSIIPVYSVLLGHLANADPVDAKHTPAWLVDYEGVQEVSLSEHPPPIVHDHFVALVNLEPRNWPLSYLTTQE